MRISLHQYFGSGKAAGILIGAVMVIVSAVYVGQGSAQVITQLTTCQTINSAGSYQLANDVSSGGDCFSIRASNVTFDGNGKTVTTGGGLAVDIFDGGSGPWSNITVKNLTSNDSVRTYGNESHDIIFENLNVYSVEVLGSDDVIVRNNTVGAGGISISNNDTVGWAPLRAQVLNNVVTGGSTSVKILVEVIGGRSHPCPRIDAVLTGNTITNTRNDPPPEATAAVRVRCATHTTFSNNTVRSTGTTIGLYMRDESDDGIYENNSFWVNSQEAIRLASGNEDKTFPARNLFRNNLFKSDAGDSTFFQGIGANNRFEYNVFWSLNGGLWNQNDGNIYDHNTLYVVSPNDSVGTLAYSQSVPDTWTNNIISIGSGQLFTYDAPWSFSRYVGDYNLFQNRGGSVTFGSPGGSLAAWRTASGNTDDMNSIEADPLFVNPAAGDFTLQAASPARGAGSAGTDIGAKPYGSSPPPTCYESWQCGSWSACSNGSQTRTCTDANACGTTQFRPPLTQTCGACVEQWSCGAWSSCSNSTQSRSCTDANACGTTASRPALTQSCTALSTSCGVTCAQCASNHILGSACTTARRQCDGTNTVEDIRLSTATVAVGQSLTVEVDYACYDSTDDNLAVWYYNGSTWQLIQFWAPNSLTGCDATVGTDGTVSTTFTPDAVLGTQYVRVIEAAGSAADAPLANASACPNIYWGNIDDMSFSVQAVVDSTAPSAVADLRAS